MKECVICMEGYKNGVKCFGSCSLEVCIGCFNKILNINEVQDICMICPQCRHLSVKGLDNKFSKYVSNNKKCLKRIVSLLEDRLDRKSKYVLDISWANFSAEHLIGLTPGQLYELTEGDYDNVPT